MQVHLLKQLAQTLIRQLSTVTLLGNLLVTAGRTLWSGSTSLIKKTDTNGDYVSANDQYFEEVGTSSWTNADGQTETRDYTYRFEVDNNGDLGNFLGGTETVDGETLHLTRTGIRQVVRSK